MKGPILPLVAVAVPLAAIAFAAGRWTAPAVGPAGTTALTDVTAADQRLGTGELSSIESSGKVVTGSTTLASRLASSGAPGEELGILSTFDEPDRVKRKQQYYALLADMTLDDVDTLREYFSNITDWTDRHQSEYAEFLYTWAKLDGRGAMEFVMNDESRRSSRARTSAMSGWVLSDPASAKQYVGEMEDGDTKEWLHYGIVAGLVDSDLDAAIAYAPTNGRSRARGEAIERIAERLFAEQGADGVMAWIDSISPNDTIEEAGSYRDGALREALERIAEVDPDRALAVLKDEGSADYMKSETYYRVAREAADGDEAAALEIIGDMPTGNARDQAMFGMLRNLSNRNPNEAASWIDAQPAGDLRDRATDTFANSIFRKEPETALTWASTIGDTERRTRTVNRLANDWLRREGDAARKWFTDNPQVGVDPATKPGPPRG